MTGNTGLGGYIDLELIIVKITDPFELTVDLDRLI
jgi:hypothetical protein